MVNVAIIGSNFGNKVHLPAFQLLDNINTITICDKYKWLDIMENESIDAVSIAVPPHKSYEIIKSAIEHKKHIFCEKPICATLQEAKNLSTLLTNDIITAVNFEMCESAVIKKLRELIHKKELGKVKKYSLTWGVVNYGSKDSQSWKSNHSLGGGLLNNFGSHIFNLLEYIFVDKISTIEINLKNSFVSFLTFFPGFTGHNYIHYHDLDVPEFNLTIKCENGVFVLSNETKSLINFTLAMEKEGKQTVVMKKEDLCDIDGRIELTSSLAKKFIMGIKEKKQIRPNLLDGLRVRELMENI